MRQFSRRNLLRLDPGSNDDARSLRERAEKNLGNKLGSRELAKLAGNGAPLTAQATIA